MDAMAMLQAMSTCCCRFWAINGMNDVIALELSRQFDHENT